MSNDYELVPTQFFKGAKNFARGLLLPVPLLVTGLCMNDPMKLEVKNVDQTKSKRTKEISIDVAKGSRGSKSPNF